MPCNPPSPARLCTSCIHLLTSFHFFNFYSETLPSDEETDETDETDDDADDADDDADDELVCGVPDCSDDIPPEPEPLDVDSSVVEDSVVSLDVVPSEELF